MLGEIDVLVCGNSDPGTSGLLSPFAKIDGLYFDPSDEPDDFYFNLVQDLKEKAKENGQIYITCEYDNPNDFYNGMSALKKYTEENIVVSGTSREGTYELVINEDSDMDDQTKPQTVALAKKKKKKPAEEEDESVSEDDATTDDSIDDSDEE